MSLVGLLVTICLLLGMGIVIALVLFFPYSTVNQSSWEPVFRSYDENIKAVSKSHLLTALLDRYERYVRPLVSPPTEGKAPLPMTRSPEYLETSKLLQRMVSPHFSYTKMFPGNDQVFVLSVRTFDVFSEEFKRPQNMTRGIGTYSPLVGKVVLFRVPAITLLNKNESLNLTSNEAMGLNVCWSTFLPGSPVNVAFSNGYKQMAFVYRIIVPGGVRYRIRYYPRIECSPDYAESPSSDYYQKYSELTLRADTEYAKLYDDVYVPAYAYVGALAVGENRLAYTLVYDVYAFRVVEKVAGKWRERDDVPVVNRQEAVYSFCSDLFFVDRGDNTLLIAFTRDGNSLSKLTNHIEMFELNNGSPSSELSRVYNYDFQTIALTFTLGDLESPPEAGSLLAISADKDLAFVSKTSDHSFFMELPQGNKSAHFPVAVSSWTGNQAIAALKDLSIIATYVRDSSSITFFATSNSAYLGTEVSRKSRDEGDVAVAAAKVAAEEEDRGHGAYGQRDAFRLETVIAFRLGG